MVRCTGMCYDWERVGAKHSRQIHNSTNTSAKQRKTTQSKQQKTNSANNFTICSVCLLYPVYCYACLTLPSTISLGRWSRPKLGIYGQNELTSVWYNHHYSLPHLYYNHLPNYCITTLAAVLPALPLSLQVAWDSTGRYVASVVANARMDNSYAIYTFFGH